MKNTKEIMSSNLLTVKANDSIANAYKFMHGKGIRHLPVVDEKESIVGILSDRDIQRAMQVIKINNFQQEVQIDASILVEDLMSWPVYVVSESTSILKVAEEMLTQKVSAFLVQNDAGRVKGIITTDDMLRLILMTEQEESRLGQKAVSYFFSGPEVM